MNSKNKNYIETQLNSLFTEIDSNACHSEQWVSTVDCVWNREERLGMDTTRKKHGLIILSCVSVHIFLIKL